MIIFLNGTSSAGKSSLSKALQELHPTPLLHVGLDTFFFMLSPQYLGHGEKAEAGFQFISQGDEHGPLTHVQTGPYGERLCNTAIDVVGLMAGQGHDLVIDEVLLRDGSLEHYVEALKARTVYFIGVHCDLQTLREREHSRGDRMPGLGRALSQIVHHASAYYDLEIDTTHKSSLESAQTILEFVKNTPHPQGFEKLREMRSRASKASGAGQ